MNRTIYSIWLNDEPLGALYALHDELAEDLGGANKPRPATYFYQSGFDPAYSKLSPGTVMIAHAIRRAIEGGYTTFDFLRGDEAYKRRWKPTKELASGSALLPITPIGWAQASFLQIAGKVEASARARFEGKSILSPSRSLERVRKAP